MPGGSDRERVISVIRVSSRHLDDDQIAVRAGISPRQAVNQVCRALERAGMVRRRPGPDGKIVNEWLGDQKRGSTALPAGAIPVTGGPADPGVVPGARAAPAGDSGEQRAAERVMLDLLVAQLGRELNPATITIASGERAEVDGADASRAVLAECWARQGPPKSAQRHNVLADAFKLAWIATTINPRPQLILCLSDPLAAAPFLPARGPGQPGRSKTTASPSASSAPTGPAPAPPPGAATPVQVTTGWLPPEPVPLSVTPRNEKTSETPTEPGVSGRFAS